MVIDYKNRTIIIADGISGDGQKTVSINYDRFDKVTYTKDQSGAFVFMDGTSYTPSVLPENNSILSASFESGGATVLYLTFQNAVPADYIQYLAISNDGGLVLSSVVADTTTTLTITFESEILVGTIVTISGSLYNMAYEQTIITPYLAEKQIYLFGGFGNTYADPTDFCIHIPMEENTTFYINYVTSEVTLNGLVPSETSNGWYSINDVDNIYGFGSGWMCINLLYSGETLTTSVVGTSALICL
jgi:hypothetical protein